MKPFINFCIGLLLLVGVSASAHLTYSSEVYLDMSDRQTYLEIRIPVDDLLLALPERLAQQPLTELTINNVELLAYLYAHLSAYIDNPGKPLNLIIQSVEVNDINDVKRLVIQAQINNSVQESLNKFIIHDNLVTHKVINHKSIAILRSDFENSQLVAQPEPIGTFDYQHEELQVNRATGSRLNGTLGFIKMGIDHIDHGVDHLAFLLCLLLISPLVLSNTSWKFSGSKDAVIKVIKLVSLFTVGHTATLILVSFNIISPDQDFIEILICITIILTALHAIKSIRYFHETQAALLFGLIHGAAFSSTLKEFHFDSVNFALSLAGFNIGIEIAQIIAIVLVFPWLLLLSQQARFYMAVKNSLAFILLYSAIYWLYQRITHQQNNLDNISGWDIYMHYVLVAIAVLILLNVIVNFIKSKQMRFLNASSVQKPL